MGRALVAGVADGGVYGLLALGIFLAYRDARVLNLAHGEVGTFAVLAATAVVGRTWPFGALLAIVIATSVTATFQRVVVARMEGSSPSSGTVATVGLALLLIGLELKLPDATVSVPPPIDGLGPRIFDYYVAPAHLLALGIAVFVGVGLTAFTRRTYFGLASLAASDNPTAARLMGIPASAISALTWGASGAVAAVSALLAGSLFGALHPGFGTALLVRGLAGAIIGGLKSPWRVVTGGIVVGVIDSVVGYLFVRSRLPGLSTLVVMALVVAISIARPFASARLATART